MLCGVLFQSSIDRKVPPGATPETNMIARLAAERRQAWADRHSIIEHTEKDHLMLAISGRQFTPEAAARLQQYGVIPITDMLHDEEVADALATTTSTPQDDARDR